MQLSLDMDGVLADFDARFEQVAGRSPHGMTSKQVCKVIADTPGFFRQMPVLPGAKDAVRALAPLNPVVLTSCPASCYAAAAADKQAWVREHFGELPVLPVYGAKHKHLYLQHPGAVLVDDWGSNCDDWEAAGGIAIKHTDWATTFPILQDMLL